MSATSPHFAYHVEVRDKSGNLLEIAQKDIASLVWSYESIGGCGDAEIVLRRQFDNFGDLGLDYDVRIRRTPTTLMKPGDRASASGWGGPFPILLAGDTGKSELRYRGVMRAIQPVFDELESVRLRCSGYSRQLEYISVPAQTYASQDVGAAARSIIDTFVTSASQIKRTASLSKVQDQSVVTSATGLTFDTSAYEALRTLAEIGGNAEWGVTAGLNPDSPEDNEIYFLARSAAVKQTWVIGDRVKFFESEKNTDEEVRKVFLRGSGSFTATVTSSSGNDAGYSKERIILVPSIAHATDATLWATAFYSRFENAQEKGRTLLGATDAWIENVEGQSMPPLGKLRLMGGVVYRRSGARLAAQFGASGIKLVSTIGGTTFKEFRIERVRYRPRGNALEVEIELGEKSSALHDYLRGIEFKLSELRQSV